MTEKDVHHEKRQVPSVDEFKKSSNPDHAAKSISTISTRISTASTE